MEINSSPKLLTIPQTVRFQETSSLSGRRLILIQTPPPSDGTTDLSLEISIAYKIYPMGIHTLLEGFWTKSGKSAYMPVNITLDTGQTKTVYIKVRSVAKQLFSSSVKEARQNITNSTYWTGRVQVIKKTIQTIQDGDPSKPAQKSYDQIAKMHGVGFKLKEGQSAEIDRYHISTEGEGVSIRYDIAQMGRGGFASVHKTILVSTALLRAVKKPLPEKDTKTKNPVVASVMEYQKSQKTSHLLKVHNIRQKGSSFEEEYEMAIGDIGKEFMTYSAENVKKLYKSVTSALQEFKQVGFLYLDIKPDNILNVADSKNPEFKLGDFDASSPPIKDEAAFRTWIQTQPPPGYTTDYNIRSDIDKLTVLREIASIFLTYKDPAHVKIALEQLAEKHRDLQGIEATISGMTATVEKEGIDKAFTEVFTAYKTLGEKIAIFQLGCMLYTASVGTPPYEQTKKDPRDPQAHSFCAATEGAFAGLQNKLLQDTSKGDPAFKNLIARMLDPNPDNRPSLDELPKN